MNNSVIVGILLVIVIAVVGYLAYTQGYFTGKEEEDQSGINIDLGSPRGENY